MNLHPEFFSDDAWMKATNRHHMSSREADVAALRLNGCTETSIAAHLAIQPDTVRTYSQATPSEDVVEDALNRPISGPRYD